MCVCVCVKRRVLELIGSSLVGNVGSERGVVVVGCKCQDLMLPSWTVMRVDSEACR